MSLKEIKEYARTEIKKGVSKRDIEKELSKKYRGGLYKSILNQYPETSLIKKYNKYNNVLITLIVISAILKVVTIFLIDLNLIILGAIALFAVLVSYVVIDLIRNYQKNGYIIVGLLGIVGLLNFGYSFESTITTLVYLIFIIYGLSIPILAFFLYKRLFPKNINH